MSLTRSFSVSLNPPPSLSVPPHSQSWHCMSHCAADVGRVLLVWVSCVILWGNPGDFVQDTAGIDWQPQPLPESNMTERNLISPPPFTLLSNFTTYCPCQPPYWHCHSSLRHLQYLLKLPSHLSPNKESMRFSQTTWTWPKILTFTSI